MSIISLPRDIMLEICKYFERNYLDEWISGRTYELWWLYITSKSFSWLNDLEYLCIEPSNIYNYRFAKKCNKTMDPFNFYGKKIICRNIYGRCNGMIYQGADCLLGYYALEKITKTGYALENPPDGYNYSRWEATYQSNYVISGRSTPGSYYQPDICDRLLNGSCLERSKENSHPIPVWDKLLSKKWIEKCNTCTQLDAIEKEIFEKDFDVSTIFKNKKLSSNYSDGTIMIRKKKPMLNFKFEFDQ